MDWTNTPERGTDAQKTEQFNASMAFLHEVELETVGIGRGEPRGGSPDNVHAGKGAFSSEQQFPPFLPWSPDAPGEQGVPGARRENKPQPLVDELSKQWLFGQGQNETGNQRAETAVTARAGDAGPEAKDEKPDSTPPWKPISPAALKNLEHFFSDASPDRKHHIIGKDGAFDALQAAVSNDPRGWADRIKESITYRDGLPADQVAMKAKVDRQLSLIYLAIAADSYSEGNTPAARKYMGIAEVYLADSFKLSPGSGLDDFQQIQKLDKSLTGTIGKDGDDQPVEQQSP